MFEKHQINLGIVLYSVLVMLTSLIFHNECGFDWSHWGSNSSLKLHYIIVYLLVVLPLLYQIVFRSIIGWLVINTVLLFLAIIIIGITTFDNALCETKTGMVDITSIMRKQAIEDTIILILLIIVFSIVTYPKFIKLVKTKKKNKGMHSI